MHVLPSLKLWGYLMYYRLLSGGPRRYRDQWDSYWRSVGATGRRGRVLWDNVPERASAEDLERFAPWMDPALPLVDLGCGNGRQSRFLVRHFPRVIGVDVSPAAVELARRESDQELAPADRDRVEYRVLDATDPQQASRLHEELGDVNIYIRGVLHVIQTADRARFVSSLESLLGAQGALYQIELTEEALGYFRSLPGDSPSGLPQLVHEVVRHGLRPVGFHLEERRRWYPKDRWRLVEMGEAAIHTVPLGHGEEGEVPAGYLILQPRTTDH